MPRDVSQTLREAVHGQETETTVAPRTGQRLELQVDVK